MKSLSLTVIALLALSTSESYAHWEVGPCVYDSGGPFEDTIDNITAEECQRICDDTCWDYEQYANEHPEEELISRSCTLNDGDTPLCSWTHLYDLDDSLLQPRSDNIYCMTDPQGDSCS